jgi:hypothetical protein
MCLLSLLNVLILLHLSLAFYSKNKKSLGDFREDENIRVLKSSEVSNNYYIANLQLTDDNFKYIKNKNYKS